MIELIIAFAFSIHSNIDYSKHYKMNASTAERIIEMEQYDERGGDSVFFNIVSIDNSIKGDIVITDDDNPKN